MLQEEEEYDESDDEEMERCFQYFLGKLSYEEYMYPPQGASS